MKHLKTFENYEPINEELGVKDILLSGLASIILSFGMAGNSQAKNNKPTAETELSSKDAKSKSKKIIAELNSDQQKLVTDFIKYCKGKGKLQFDNFKDQKNKKDKKQALDILIESFCDEMGFKENDDEKDFILTFFDIENISVEIK